MSGVTNYSFVNFARGYAILGIALFHILQRLPLPSFLAKAITFGGTGVHLFFLLSGFGLALSKRSEGVWPFYRRRLTKVWSPYVLALSISLVLSLTLGLFPDRWDAFWAGILGYQMFSSSYIESFGGHFWFLSAILQFYVLFPFLTILYEKMASALRFFLVCLGISVIWWVLVGYLGKGGLRNWNSCCLQFLWEFGAGMALAKTLMAGSVPAWAHRFWSPERWWQWGMLGSVFAAIMLVMVLKGGSMGLIFNDVPALLGYGMICVAAFFFLGNFVPPLRRFFEWTGDISYSFYLTHIIILELFLLMLRYWGKGLHLFYVPLFFGLAFIFALIFEKMSQFISQKF